MAIPFTTQIKGVEVPTVGIGTFEVDADEARDEVQDALEAGYRHVDTATAYSNEEHVGEGIRRSGVDRSELWITTKVWIDDFEPDALRRSAESSLKKLGLDQLDLLLLHWPSADEDLDHRALAALQELRGEGKLREFGVSNFPPNRFARALRVAPEIFANQVEYHPHLAQDDLLAVAAEHDVLIEAYAPLGSGKGVLDEPLLQELADAKSATVGQIALAWLARQERVVVLPRSTKPERRRENLAALEVDLTDDESDRLHELARTRAERHFSPDFAPDWND